MPFDDIIRIISSYDIGLFLLPPVNFNYTYALPNKFFEFIQARLCIAIGPSEEMKKIVETYNIGIISEDFSAYSLKKVFLSLDKDQILKYKTNCNIAARFTSADIYYQKYLESINKMCL
ncbi:MAG: hypothetical protein H0U27_14260 [Nitrosopumilus sp.]|nr:hypothetical protein [Nitrosopumilus sp.]